MNCFTLKVILTVAITLITASCSFVNEKPYVNKDVTLYDKEFLKGKVSSIIYDDEQGYDSILFVYNSKQHLVKTVYYSDKEERGYCRYNYNGSNRVDLHYYDNNQKETSYSIIEFDDNKNVTLCRDYGYIYPDDTEILQRKQSTKRCF